MIRGEEQPIYDFLAEIKGQLFIPIYQRKYTWKDENREYFWKYLEQIDLEDEHSKHYLHAVLTKVHGSKFKSKNSIRRISIIDGQQRILTSALLYCAICAFSKEHDVDFDWENEIYYTILINQGKTGDEKYRIIPKDIDEDTFKMIVDDLPISLKETAGTTQIIKTYNFFLNKLTEDNVEDIYYKFDRFVIGNDVAESHDNPQTLFETINFAGTPLKSFEMVRCYTLMPYDKETQKKLYYKYWYPLSKKFNEKELKQLFVSYDYYYNGSLSGINIMQVLERYDKNGQTTEEFLKDICEFANKFEKVIHCNIGISDVDQCIKMITQKKLLIPVIIRLYDKFLNNSFKREEFVSCIKLMDSTVVRLIIADASSAGTYLRNIFFNLERCTSSFQGMWDVITSKKTELKQPKHIVSDSLFENKLLLSNFYKDYSSTFVYLFLERLNFAGDNGKDYNLNKYEIEHIMPQSPDEHWKDYLGENYETIISEHCNRLGNLTLIHEKKNKINSNKSFEDKKKKLEEDGIWLNKDIIHLSHWNQDTIQNRTVALAKLATNVFSYPTYIDMGVSKNQTVLVGGK